MKFRYLLLIFSFISLTGCQRGPAFNYNQKLVEIENSMLPDVERTSRLLDKYIDSGNYDSMAVVSQQMADIVEKKTNEVRNDPAPKVKEAETFKKAYISYFEYMKSIYISYKDFALNQNEATRQNMLTIENMREQAINELKAIQLRYANANGFKMEGE